MKTKFYIVAVSICDLECTCYSVIALWTCCICFRLYGLTVQLGADLL